MKTLQLLCPEHSEGAAHLGKKSSGQVCPGGFVLCRAVCVCATKIDVNFVSTGTLPVLFTMVSAVPRTVPGIY